MSAPRPKVLCVDDAPLNLRLLEAMLTPLGYDVVTASSVPMALERARAEKPDIVVSDVVMAGMTGYDLTRKLREDEATRDTPIVLITASGSTERVKALEAGADDFMTKPLDEIELLARIKSLLRLKEYHDTIERQRKELEAFVSPQIAQLIATPEGRALMSGHRREVTVVFTDIRGFTAFTETAAPEDALVVVREYQQALGELILRHGGTLGYFQGDGMMVFFNDPVPVADHPLEAVKMTLAMRDRMADLAKEWAKRGHELGFGCGVATGYATLGRIGFEGRYDYTAMGTVANLAARFASWARTGQILLSQRTYSAVEDGVVVEPLGDLSMKGFGRAQPAYNVLKLKERVPTQA
jgi:class 3 adenylate cyclase